MNRFPSLAVLLLASWSLAEAPATQPGRPTDLPYRIIHEERTDPPQRLWVLEVDLSDPRVAVKVAPAGDDPDGDGPWQTTLMPTSAVAEREGFEAAVNASFFSARKTTNADGKPTGYRDGVWSSAVGWTMTDGREWAKRENDWPVLWIDGEGKARITPPAEVTSAAAQVVAGNTFIMVDGEAREPFKGMMLVRHPRTVVGVNRDGTKLTILTVDGRRPGKSIGMTGQELLDELKKRNVATAINLDGGGSTTLVERDPATGELKVLNAPSDGRERSVANVLGIDVKDR